MQEFCWSAVLRQDYGHFQGADGSTGVFQCYRRGEANLQRIQQQGVISHFFAQRRALVAWLGGGSDDRATLAHHAVVTRIYDDTNVWIAPQKRVAAEEGAADQASAGGLGAADPKKSRGTVGRQGKRKSAFGAAAAYTSPCSR